MDSGLFDLVKGAIKDKLDEFKRENPDKSPFVDGKEHSADELAAGVMSILAPKPDENHAENETESYSIKTALDRVRSELEVKPVIKLELVSSVDISVFESKVGGLPYMPKGYEYPVGISGTYENRPLRFLAQLNFEKLPHIKDFPEKGILQFFCSDDDDECVYGADFDSPANQDGFRIIYHKDIIADEAQLCSTEDLPAISSEGFFPVTGEFILVPSAPEKAQASIEDFRFEELLCKYCSEICGKRIDNIYMLSRAGFDKQEINELYCSDDAFRSCIGGYPAFTQSDPRSVNKLGDCDTLLFQLNSFFDREDRAEIMWGDMGIANFFIPSNDLRQCDFSRVAFNWDCT